MEDAVRAIVGWVLASVTVGVFAVAGCSVKNEASDKICQPSQKVRCNDCTKEDPTDTRPYRGWQKCSPDGKSFIGKCEECAPDDVSGPSVGSDLTNGPSSSRDGGSLPSNGSTPEGGVSSGRGTTSTGAECEGPPTDGDLRVVEIMIASEDTSFGGDDFGEWFEIQNARDCRLNLKGVQITSPTAFESVDSVDITEDFWLEPNTTFIVADTTEPAGNHHLPGKVIAWNTPRPNTLSNNTLDEIVISFQRTEIERLSWNADGWMTPKLADGSHGNNYGTSVSFSIGCTWPERASWANWRWSSNPFYSTWSGTPNAENSDISCPHVPVNQ